MPPLTVRPHDARARDPREPWRNSTCSQLSQTVGELRRVSQDGRRGRDLFRAAEPPVFQALKRAPREPDGVNGLLPRRGLEERSHARAERLGWSPLALSSMGRFPSALRRGGDSLFARRRARTRRRAAVARAASGRVVLVAPARVMERMEGRRLAARLAVGEPSPAARNRLAWPVARRPLHRCDRCFAPADRRDLRLAAFRRENGLETHPPALLLVVFLAFVRRKRLRLFSAPRRVLCVCSRRTSGIERRRSVVIAPARAGISSTRECRRRRSS